MTISFLLFTPHIAAADQISNPHSVVFDIQCDLDGNGSLETSFEVLTFLNETRTGQDVASQSVLTLVSGFATITVNGEVVVTRAFREKPGEGLRTVSCEATGSFTDSAGNAVVITITDAVFLLTPPGAP